MKTAACIQTLVTLALLCAITACGVDRTDPALSRAGQNSAPASKPNIILFLVDDMGLMDTSVPMLVDEEGKSKRHPLNDWYRTPNMERLKAMMLGMVRELESMDAVYPVKEGQMLEPIIQKSKKS